MAVVVRRASHSHHVPQVGFPQSDPTASISAVNTTPISADAPASRSHVVLRVRGMSHRIDASAVTPNARYASHAHGTCRYSRRTAWNPWFSRGGVTYSARNAVTASATRVAAR